MVERFLVELGVRVAKRVERFAELRRLEDNITTLRDLDSHAVDSAPIRPNVILNPED